MSRKDEIKKLISIHHRRLQKLKEQKASFGPLHTPAHILTEIEDTEAEIEKLETELKALEGSSVDEESPSTPTLRITLEYLPESSRGTTFLVRLTNYGTQRINLRQVLLHLDTGASITYDEVQSKDPQLPIILPKKLDETDFCELCMPLYPLHQANSEFKSPLQVTQIEAIDTLGNSYFYPEDNQQSRSTFEELRQEIQDHWNENNFL